MINLKRLCLILAITVSPWHEIPAHPEPQASTSVPAEIVRSMVLVPVEVNGVSLTFILDSGAGSNFLLDEAAARRLRLELHGQQQSSGAGEKRVALALAHGLEIHFADIQFSGQNAAVTDMAAISAYLGRNVDGVLGTEIFRRAVVELDYCGSRVHIRSADGYHPPRQAAVIPIVPSATLLFAVRATLELHPGKEVLGTFLLDSGAGPVEVALTHEQAAKTGLLTKEVPEESIPALGGDFRAKVVAAERIRIGETAVSKVTVDLAENTAGAMARGEYAGLLGGRFFRRFLTIFDVPHQRLVLAPNPGCEAQ
jgi:predicted aspartyl protease